MARQEFTVDQLRKLVRYEPDTGYFFWNERRKGVLDLANPAGYTHHTGYRYICINRVVYALHRLAWMYVFGEFPQNHIDHINGIQDDNRICNLRDVERSTNMQNQRKAQKRNANGLLGVTTRPNSKFQASIRLKGKLIHIGTFNTPELAHAAYLDAKRKHHAGCTI